MSVGRILWCSALAVSLSQVSQTLDCQASCLMFGVKDTAFSFRQRAVSDYDDAESNYSSSAYSMLSLHNGARQGLASGSLSWPPASNMRLLEWDEDLENLAQESLALWLSTTCTLSPPECFWTTPTRNFAYNYAMAGAPGSAPSLEEIFDSWTLFESPNTENPGFWSSFSNVMAANNTRLGCGETVMEERSLVARFVLCYYELGSNCSRIDDLIVDESLLYRRGAPCSGCPVGTACNASSIYPNLCAVDNTLTTTISSGDVPNSNIKLYYYQFLVILLVTPFYG